ncbi:MAG: CoA transferase, partial [Chloroflexi bacterium]|nr:CoA transferase [Chloroflexota bacterium]
NLKLPAGVELAKRIVAISDVVIENFTVDVIHRLGLDYEVLRKVKPDIIMLSACFGGQSGPYRNFRGQGSVIAALQGFDDLTGWPDRAPASPGVAFGDHYLPWVWSTIILAALRYRRETGKGMFIDGSSFEGCLDVLDTSIADYSVNGRVLKRGGNRSATAAPHGIYRCKGDDRWVAITVSKDEEWQGMCKTLGDLPWPQDREFSTAAGRLARADELDALVEGWTVNQVAENVMLRLQEAGVAAEVVNNAADMHSDPQLAFRGHFWETDEVGMEPFTFEAPSSRLSLTPATFRRRGPFLGEHNDYVFLDLLGMSTEEFASLIEQKVIY